MEATDLKKIAADFIPEEFANIHWGDIWNIPVRSGTGLEWTVFAALASALRATGWNVEFPHLANNAIREFFPDHNRFPAHYTGKVGHSSIGPKPGLMIMAALTPKAIASKDGRWISIFREGCAYHRIYAERGYEDRPDILIARGRPAPGFPNYDERENAVAYRYAVDESQTIKGVLRAVNSINPIMIERTPSGG